MSQQEQQDKSQYFYRASAADFMKIPGGPVAYWVTKSSFDIFSENPELGSIANARVGLQTSDNDRFLRFWHEVSFKNIAFGMSDRGTALASKCKWFPCNKGGEFKKWYGNHFFVVNWENDGDEIKNFRDEDGRLISRPQNMDFYFQEAISWSDVTSSANAFRYFPQGFINDATGHSAFGGDYSWKLGLAGYCNNIYVNKMAKILNPTIHFHIGYFNKLPYASKFWEASTINNVEELVRISKIDWDSYETSWNFEFLPLCELVNSEYHIVDSYKSNRIIWDSMSKNIQRLEIENNTSFIELYKINKELDPNVPIEEVTLTCNPFFRFGNLQCNDDYEKLLLSETIKEAVSYSVGCMMGRYSIDKPGLILASQGETLQDYLNQIPNPRFMPDDDAILPLTDQEWFADDVTNRVREFVKVVWGEETLAENLTFIADSLCLHAIKSKKDETALETIRRYLSTQFYKDHLKTYKKRPIYWLFSSGKEKAFECLVYLHRYNEGTLARMRNEYVTPLMGKFETQLTLWRDELLSAAGSQQRAIEKQIKDLEKKQLELRAFDEQLKHYADMRIQLDLDDGVKVNYGKFGQLLAEVKAVTGDKD